MKLSDQILRKPFYVAFGQALAGGGITSVDLVAVRDASTVTITASDGSAAPIAGADASTAGVMTAADKTKLDGLSDTPAQGFPSRLDVAASVIDAGASHVLTAGHSTAGDGGGALYKRVGAAPTHNLKVQSSDGAWWALVPDSHGYVNVKQAGAKGDDTTNDFQAFKDALEFASLNAGANDNATYGVIVPPSDTAYYLGANTLELKATVHLVGQGSGQAGGNPCKLRWDANITGIIVHRHNTIGAGKEALGGAGNLSADGTKIEGLQLDSDGGTIAGVTDSTKGHGIWLRARAVLIDLHITGFPGNGINIVAGAGAADDVEGNANGWQIERARITGCHLSGIFVDGADVNAGMAQNVDVSSNGRWGIWDSSFLGNTYIGCHASNNGLGGIGENTSNVESSYVHLGGRLYAAKASASEAQLVATTPGTDETVWYDMASGSSSNKTPTWLAAQSEGTYFHGGPYHSDGANARNVFTGNYSEGGQGPSQWVTPTTVFGGFIGNVKGSAVVFRDDKMLGSVGFPNHEEFAPSRDLTLTINASVNHLLKASADGDHSVGMNLLAWNESSGQWLIGEHANSSGRRPIRITTNLNTTNHGRATAQVGGELYFYKGFWVGNGTAQAKFFRGFTQKPTSGEVARGDKYWNYNPTVVGAPAGWRVVTGGTLGSTAILEEYFYAPELPGDHPGYTLRPKSDGGNRVQWRECAKAGTDTIIDTASTVVVAFTNALANANYAVALSADGDERVWVTSKTASGFTINRAASAGARAVDWTATPHEDL